ncbi:unnamed protein product [Rangifer tarandus platyrhynchus]|uniref:Uncharacterized protein n=3 Tax=Rangifer tarandus platyrhynchus TaxID=3082113 RepID=A0AC59YKJ7_RANTA|nr:unnamed protein product [Rangifer tarandus platyrhynchus]CAI9696156.1 unnamed protein product [Rangifer tarandus platyrhynchus]
MGIPGAFTVAAQSFVYRVAMPSLDLVHKMRGKEAAGPEDKAVCAAASKVPKRQVLHPLCHPFTGQRSRAQRPQYHTHVENVGAA